MPGLGERTLADLIEVVRSGRAARRPILLLMGAGCSASAGVPLAADIVERIRVSHPRAYQRADPKTYPSVLGQLMSGERRSLIREVTQAARVGWGHLAVAEMIRVGAVDRVITTNFDDLIEVGAQIAGVRLAVYDVPSSLRHDEERIASPALFYLHGQAEGVVVLNTPGELSEYRARIGPVVSAGLQGRTVVVVGYKGLDDPLVDVLREHGTFEFGLYWLDHGEADDPPLHLRSLIRPERGVFRVRAQSSDIALCRIAHALGCFPPRLVSRPFSYLADLLERIGPLEDPPLGLAVDLLAPARAVANWVVTEVEKQAVDAADTEMFLPTPELFEAAVTGDYCRALAIAEGSRQPSDPPSELEVRLAARCAVDLFQRGTGAHGAEARELLARAESLGLFVAEHTPEDPVAQYNLACTRLHLADIEEPSSAVELRRLAESGFRHALQLRPDYVRALRNLADCLGDLADTSGPQDQRRFYSEALELFAQVIEKEPTDLTTRFLLGQTRVDLAHLSMPDEAVALLEAAAHEFREILKADPQHGGALRWLSVSLGSLSAIDLYPARREADVEAEKIMRSILASAPEEPSNLSNLARLYLLRAKNGEGNIALQRQALKEALAMCSSLSVSVLVGGPDPLGCTEARMMMAQLEVREDHEEEACALAGQIVEDLRSFLKLQPGHYLAEAYLAMALGMLGEAQESSAGHAALLEAEERMRKLIERDPSDWGTRFNHASVLVYLAARSPRDMALRLVDEAEAELAMVPRECCNADTMASLQGELQHLREQDHPAGDGT